MLSGQPPAQLIERLAEAEEELSLYKMQAAKRLFHFLSARTALCSQSPFFDALLGQLPFLPSPPPYHVRVYVSLAPQTSAWSVRSTNGSSAATTPRGPSRRTAAGRSGWLRASLRAARRRRRRSR